MTTYTKETALYDTGAIGDGISEAGQTADRYITVVDSNGIQVHAENNPTNNYTQINANGMEVFNEGTSIAKFGSSARIGIEDDASINITPISITGSGADNVPFFEFSSSGGTSTIAINKTKSREFEVSEVNAGNRLRIMIPDAIQGSEVIVEITIGETRARVSTTVGVSESKNITLNNNIVFTMENSGASRFMSATLSSGIITGTRVVFMNVYYYESAEIEAPVYKLGNALKAPGWSLAVGKYNDNSGNYNFSIGNGTSDSARSNVFAVNENGIADLYKITECGVSTGSSISAHSYKDGASYTIPSSARVSGYNLVGVMGWATTNYRIIPHTHYVVDNTHLFVGFSNTSASNVTASVTVTFRLLWLKGTAKA